MTCPNCHTEIQEHLYELQLRACPHCAAELTRTAAEASFAPARGVSVSSAPAAHTYGFTFGGNTNEFFRIWIVNIFLSVITLGIYNAWAKVRTRRYFYAHTSLAGHSFDYLAQPLAIFKGNLIVGVGFVGYLLLQRLRPELSYLALGLYALLFPWPVYQTLRFRAHYSAYRGVRFRFLGSLAESYRSYLLWPLLVPLTLGLGYPLVAFKQQRYYAANMAFGTTLNRFAGRPGKFYQIYAVALGIVIIGYVGVFGVLLALPNLSFATNASAGSYRTSLLASLILMYLLVISLGLLLQQFVYARVSNYTWAHSTLGQVRFTSTLRASALVRIRLGNLLAILGSLGLLIPWAKVRYTRYLLAHLQVTAEGDLDSFMAAKEHEQNALGDAAADLLDFDIGL